MVPIHLLVVDDEELFVETINERLRQRGFTVSGAYSGQEALDQVAGDDSLEVIILDIAMPGMGGIETLKMIKNKQPLIEIIMLTGKSTVNSAVEAMKLGAFDYVSKPCDLDELIAKIKAAAERKRDRERRILEARTKPYISEHERDEIISKILNS
jgi:DNA-binding NtrC family response regulator